MRTLDQLLPDNTGTITALHVGQELQRRMAGLGLKPGTHVRVMRRSPMHGPLQVRAGHTDIILRRSDAARIEVCLAP
jgi:ferrous iron transport protein A